MPIYNKTKVSATTPAITAGGYSAADVVGGQLSFTLPSAGGGGIIRKLVIADDDNEKAAMDIYFFDDSQGTPTVIADNAPFAPVIADLKALIGKVSVAATDYVTINGNAYAIKDGLAIDYSLIKEKLYAYAVPSGTPTYTAVTDLTFTLYVWQD